MSPSGKGSVEAELVLVRRLAEDLARTKRERPSTGHLLAALASHASSAQVLLLERRLDAEMLASSVRVATDDAADGFSQALVRAKEFAARTTAREPSGVHLLFALCQDRTTAAHRLMEQCGVNLSKLRAAVIQIAIGAVEPRRVSLPCERPAPSMAPSQPKQPLSPRPSLPASKARSIKRVSPPPARTASRLSSTTAKPKRPRTQGNDEPSVSASCPLLTSASSDWTKLALQGVLDPVFGRDTTIAFLQDVLAKRNTSSACLVGIAGVGKTAVVRGLALRLALTCEDTSVLEIDVAQLLGGTGVRGALVERLQQLRKEVARLSRPTILFFEDLSALLGNEAGDEGASELRAALSHGELRLVTTATPEVYRRVIEPALGRQLMAIEIGEIETEAVERSVAELTRHYEAHHQCPYGQDAVRAAIELSTRYLSDRAMPERALTTLDLAGARARRSGEGRVDRKHVAEVVSERAKVPLERLLETDQERMLRLEELLARRVVGHTQALSRVAAILRRNASGFRSQRPIGSFLLLGSTGIGKTETAKALAECLFHSPQAMTRLDMSEYAEPHAVARLVGAPPGYVGHDAGGQLTEAIRRKPYQVLLLDEIEKAHLDVLEAFLQVFDEGRLTDGLGRTVDFTNTVIVLTSNLGSDALRSRKAGGRIGFSADDGDETSAVESILIEAAKRELPPELYNRIDEVLAYAPLTRRDVQEIACRMLDALSRDLASSRRVTLEFDAPVIEFLLDQGGFDPEFGARPMRRTVARLVEAQLAEFLLRGDIQSGDRARVSIDTDRLVIHVNRGHRRGTSPRESRL